MSGGSTPQVPKPAMPSTPQMPTQPTGGGTASTGQFVANYQAANPGSTGPGTSTTQMPAWLQPYAQSYLQRVGQVSDMAYDPYTGSRLADMNSTQYAALDAAANRARAGNPLVDAAGGWAQQTLGGQAQQATQSPYGQVSAGTNNSQVSAGQNAFAGANPYLQQNIDNAMGDMSRAYNLSTAPALDRMAAQSGSFGNSGVQQMQMESQRQLGQQMAQTAGQMRMQDYGMQQQLAESGLNRGMQAQQFNSSTQDNNLARQMQAQQFNAVQGQDWAARNDSMSNQFAGRQLQAANMAPQFAQQDYADIAALMNAGTTMQQYQQTGLDQQYQNWQDSQNWAKQQTQFLGGSLGLGGANPGSTTSTTPQQQSTNWTNVLLGLGTAGAGVWLGKP